MQDFYVIAEIDRLSRKLFRNEITEEEFRKQALPLCENEFKIIETKMKNKVEEIIKDKCIRDERISINDKYVKSFLRAV